jgi:hypothetical protein
MLVSFDIMFLKVWHSHMTLVPCFLKMKQPIQMLQQFQHIQCGAAVGLRHWPVTAVQTFARNWPVSATQTFARHWPVTDIQTFVRNRPVTAIQTFARNWPVTASWTFARNWP